MEVTLQQILDARERRAAEQQRLLSEYGLPLICFCMNIAGPVKDTPLIRRGFDAGLTRLRDALRQAGLAIRYESENRAVTGCEAIMVVEAEAPALKAICVDIEERDPLGRLFDMDVLARAGNKLEREVERPCLICGEIGRGCASRRVHSVAELQAKMRQILTAHCAEEDAYAVAERVTAALLEEVNITPKPGLVDRANCGSHRDMTLQTFLASAEALRPYWAECVRIGQAGAQQAPAETFALLREAGKDAEQTMFAATGGVNTHKGAIYIFGVLCGAIGRLWTPERPIPPVDALLRACAALTRDAVQADFAAVSGKPEADRTAGERLYLLCGATGIRGEAAAGLPSVQKTALPLFQRLLDKGLDRNRAGTLTLLALIALGKDTNLLHRGGAVQAAAAANRAKDLLSQPQLPTEAEIAALDQAFIQSNLSPGGCADLLAVTLFLSDIP